MATQLAEDLQDLCLLTEIKLLYLLYSDDVAG